MSERPTPRTDAAERSASYFAMNDITAKIVPSKVARDLERELAEAREEAKDQARLLGMSGEREASLLAELAEAKEQRDEWQRAHNHVCKELATCEEHRDWNAGLWADMKLERDKLAERIESLRSFCTTDHESKAAFIDRVNAILYPANTPDQPPP